VQGVAGCGSFNAGTNTVEVDLTVQGATCTFTNFKQNDSRMDDVTKLFIHRRVDNLLTEGPDRSRLLRRMQEHRQEGSQEVTTQLSYNTINVWESNRSQSIAGQDTGLPWVDAVTSRDAGPSRNDSEEAFGSALPSPYGITKSSPSIVSSIASQLAPLGAGQTSFKFGTSLSEMRAAAAQAEARSQQKKLEDAGLKFENGPYIDPSFNLGQSLDFWVEGHITRYNDGLGGISREGDFRILYVGVDYALAPGILAGALVQIDDTKEDVGDPNLTGTVDGIGWMAGPYLGVKLADNLFFDTRAAWGQSSNDIELWDPAAGNRSGSFDTTRWLATATLTGNEYIGNWRITPQAGFAYGNEWYSAYANSLGQNVPGADISIGRMTVGGEVGYRVVMASGSVLEPHVSFTGIMNFATDDLVIGGALVETSESRGKVEGGLLLETPSGWGFRAAGSYDGVGGDEFESYGGSLWVNMPLN
jgi:hypothetical protein